MNQTIDKPVTREVGERVNLTLAFDPTLTKAVGDGTFECVVSTSSTDRHRESIDTQGITIDTYMQNPVVLYGHDYQGLPIGKTISLKQMKNKLTAKFQLATDIYPFAATVASMIEAGYLSAVSIGGVVKQWSDDYMTIEQMEMVEFSIVPVPANAEALITSRSLEQAAGKGIGDIEREYKDFVSQVIVDKAKTLEHNELQETIKTIERLVTHLKAAADEQEKDHSDDTPKVKLYKLKRVAQQINAESNKTIRLIKSREK